MTIHNYELELTKPANIRGSIHGKIDAYQEIYNFIANLPTNQVNPKELLDIISNSIKKLGCTNLEVKDTNA